jgi:hypothetical protein
MHLSAELKIDPGSLAAQVVADMLDHQAAADASSATAAAAGNGGGRTCSADASGSGNSSSGAETMMVTVTAAAPPAYKPRAHQTGFVNFYCPLPPLPQAVLAPTKSCLQH